MINYQNASPAKEPRGVIEMKKYFILFGLLLLFMPNVYGHHSIGDSQLENPHNPNTYTFTFADFNHCSEVQDAYESQYTFNLCKELGWDWIDGHWKNPYLDKKTACETGEILHDGRCIKTHSKWGHERRLNEQTEIDKVNKMNQYLKK